MLQALFRLLGVTGQDLDRLRLPIGHHLQHGLGRTSIAQHSHPFPGKGDTGCLEHPIETHIVRIVAFHPFRREKQGIYRSDLFCFRCNVLQIGNDSFFVRNGHIAAR